MSRSGDVRSAQGGQQAAGDRRGQPELLRRTGAGTGLQAGSHPIKSPLGASPRRCRRRCGRLPTRRRAQHSRSIRTSGHRRRRHRARGPPRRSGRPHDQPRSRPRSTRAPRGDRDQPGSRPARHAACVPGRSLRTRRPAPHRATAHASGPRTDGRTVGIETTRTAARARRATGSRPRSRGSTRAAATCAGCAAADPDAGDAGRRGPTCTGLAVTLLARRIAATQRQPVGALRHHAAHQLDVGLAVATMAVRQPLGIREVVPAAPTSAPCPQRHRCAARTPRSVITFTTFHRTPDVHIALSEAAGRSRAPAPSSPSTASARTRPA